MKKNRDKKADKPWASRIFGVFLANKGLIASVLRRYNLRNIDIEDATQETFLRALEAEKRKEIREPKRFLIGIAKNIARSELSRRSKLTHQLIDDLDPKSYTSDEPPVDEIVDSRHRMRVFGNAVLSLPPQCQKVFVLKHVYGASHKEIAAKLDIAVSTVEKHVALGLKRSREKMLQDLSETEDAVHQASVLGLTGYKRK